MNRTWILVRKEWAEVFKNRFVFFAVAFMPLLITIIPLIILNVTRNSADISALGLGNVPPEFSALCSDLTGISCAQSFVISQFLALFLIIPVMIPVTIASYSIVGEKTTHTLEPLLATPISTAELLTGKAMAAVIPALVATWTSYIIFNIGARLLISNPTVTGILIEPLWLLAIFGVGPLLAIAGISIAVMISSRVNEPRVAEQLSGLVILPIIAIMVGQTYGLIVLNQNLILWIALSLFLIDIGLLYFATQFFERETILTRWK